ncbi:MAG: response regulator, partial [Calditrichaeota bacterium]|nr:response regulator [Calditrichota bacterium]
LGLPDTRGAELAARLLAERPDLKVLYMSGYAPGAIFNQGLLNPEDALIQKPFTPEMLAKRIRKLLSVDPENPPD